MGSNWIGAFVTHRREKGHDENIGCQPKTSRAELKKYVLPPPHAHDLSSDRMAHRNKRKAARGLGQIIHGLVLEHGTSEERRGYLQVALDLALITGSSDDTVSALLEAGADAGSGFKGRKGRSALCAAAHGGNTDAIGIVLRGDHNDVNAPSGKEGMTALLWAINAGHDDAARFLLNKGADVNVVDANGKNCVHHAVDAGKVGILKHLLEIGAEPDARNKWGNTPLQYAVKFGRKVQIVSTLLSRDNRGDVNVNTTNKAGRTPLVEAVILGNVKVAKLLLEKGASATVDYCNDSETYPLLYLAKESVPMTDLLVDNAAVVHQGNGRLYGFSALHWAAAAGTHGVLERLIGRGRRLNEKFGIILRNAFLWKGGSALHAALLYDPDGPDLERLRCVNLLIQKGANANQQDADGLTPLAAMCYGFSTALGGRVVMAADILLRNGADENIPNGDGKTPLELIGSEADPHGHLKKLLENAPTDRKWRRQSSWVMCRERIALMYDDGVVAADEGVALIQWVLRANDGVFRAIVAFL